MTRRAGGKTRWNLACCHTLPLPSALLLRGDTAWKLHGFNLSQPGFGWRRAGRPSCLAVHCPWPRRSRLICEQRPNGSAGLADCHVQRFFHDLEQVPKYRYLGINADQVSMSAFPYGQCDLFSNDGLDSFTNRGRAARYAILAAFVISPPARVPY